MTPYKELKKTGAFFVPGFAKFVVEVRTHSKNRHDFRRNICFATRSIMQFSKGFELSPYT